MEKLTCEDVAHFTYCWGHNFFLQTSKGNYHWKDPDYPHGDNTIRKFNGTYKQFCQKIGVAFGRDKGQHCIKDYCPDATIID